MLHDYRCFQADDSDFHRAWLFGHGDICPGTVTSQIFVHSLLCSVARANTIVSDSMEIFIQIIHNRYAYRNIKAWYVLI